MRSLEAIRCPSCYAPLKPESSSCEYCGTCFVGEIEEVPALDPISVLEELIPLFTALGVIGGLMCEFSRLLKSDDELLLEEDRIPDGSLSYLRRSLR